MNSNPKYFWNIRRKKKWSNWSSNQGLFILRFWRRVLAFKKWFLHVLSTKSHFQTLLGRRNWYRKGAKQEIQGLRCLNSLISRNTHKWFTSLKNMCIYRINWAKPLNLALHPQSTAQMKHLDVNCCY